MYDRPTAKELIEAARQHLEQAIVPAVKADRKLYFQTLVAINVLRIVEREMQYQGGHIEAEWDRLNGLLGETIIEPVKIAEKHAILEERNSILCDDIRAGRADIHNRTLFTHLKQTVVEQLQVANPRYLQKIAAEDADPSRDAWHNR